MILSIMKTNIPNQISKIQKKKKKLTNHFLFNFHSTFQLIFSFVYKDLTGGTQIITFKAIANG